MSQTTINLNGIPYAAKDIEISFLGRIVTGVTELNYEEVPEEVQKVHVIGTKEPVARTIGKADYKGDMTLLVNEVAGIEIAADGSIKDIGEFPITVVFKALPVPLKQTLKGVKFLGKALAVSGGSANALAFKCPIDIMGISPMTAL
jgi:hypothetical protein